MSKDRLSADSVSSFEGFLSRPVETSVFPNEALPVGDHIFHGSRSFRGEGTKSFKDENIYNIRRTEDNRVVNKDVL